MLWLLVTWITVTAFSMDCRQTKLTSYNVPKMQQQDYCRTPPGSVTFLPLCMYRLHWLPVKHRIIYKVSLITFKAIQGNAPRHISDLILFKQQSCYGLRSNNECYLGYPKERTNKTTGDRAILPCGTAVWNALPTSVRNKNTLLSFKSVLKTQLFN